MPSIQPLIVTDRQSTPVNFTLQPSNRLTDGSWVVALADATGALITEMRMNIWRRITGNRVRTTLRFSVPVIATQVVNGVSTPVVLRTGYVDATFNFASDHTETERNNIVGMFASALATNKPLIHETIVKGVAVFG